MVETILTTSSADEPVNEQIIEMYWSPTHNAHLSQVLTVLTGQEAGITNL